MEIVEKVLGRIKAKRNQGEPEKAMIQELVDPNVIKFVSLKFEGNWVRKVFLDTSNAVQYSKGIGPRVPIVTVVMRSEDGVLKTSRYKLKSDHLALVIGDVIHLSDISEFKDSP